LVLGHKQFPVCHLCETASVPSGSEDLRDCIRERPTGSPRSGAIVLRCCLSRRNGTSLTALRVRLWQSSQAATRSARTMASARPGKGASRPACRARSGTVRGGSKMPVRSRMRVWPARVSIGPVLLLRAWSCGPGGDVVVTALLSAGVRVAARASRDGRTCSCSIRGSSGAADRSFGERAVPSLRAPSTAEFGVAGRLVGRARWVATTWGDAPGWVGGAAGRVVVRLVVLPEAGLDPFVGRTRRCVWGRCCAPFAVAVAPASQAGAFALESDAALGGGRRGGLGSRFMPGSISDRRQRPSRTLARAVRVTAPNGSRTRTDTRTAPPLARGCPGGLDRPAQPQPQAQVAAGGVGEHRGQLPLAGAELGRAAGAQRAGVQPADREARHPSPLTAVTTTRPGSKLTFLSHAPSRSRRRLNAVVMRTGEDLQVRILLKPERTV
jgi:hypothetical protein